MSAENETTPPAGSQHGQGGAGEEGPPPSKSPSGHTHRSGVSRHATPGLARPPLAVPPGAARLASLRVSPDLSLRGAPKPEFVPLIPTSGPRKKKSPEGSAVDRQLHMPFASLDQDGGTSRRPQQHQSSQQPKRKSFTPTPVSFSGVGGFAPSSSVSSSSFAPRRPPAASAVAQHDALSSPFATGPDDMAPVMPMDLEETKLSSEEKRREFERACDPEQPIQLPMVDPREPEPRSKKADVAEALGPAGEEMGGEMGPTTVPFHDSYGRLMNDDQLFLVQMPSHLPLRVSKEAQEAMQRRAAEQELEKQHEFEVPPFHGSLGGLDGYAGKLLVHRSGKVTLQLGSGSSSTTFEVKEGCRTKFLEELFVIESSSKQCFRLGEVERRILVMPNADSLGLSATAPSREAQQAPRISRSDPVAERPLSASLMEPAAQPAIVHPQAVMPAPQLDIRQASKPLFDKQESTARKTMVIDDD